MYKRILIVVDERPVARSAIAEGTALARAHGAEVLFFCVLPSYVMPFADMPVFADISIKDFERDVRTRANELLSAAADVAERAGVMWRKASGGGNEDSAKVIVEAARRRGCDLIVIASQGRNAMLRLLMGSAIPGLITEAPMPVLVVKHRVRQAANDAAAIPPRRAARRKERASL